MPLFEHRGTLHAKTFDLLKQCKLSLPEIYKETGLPYYWLKKFSADEVKDPSVNRVQYLYEFLTSKKLEV